MNAGPTVPFSPPGSHRRAPRAVVVCLVLGVLLSPGGCTLTPDYRRPAAPIPDRWPAGAAYDPDPGAGSAPAAPDVRWREFLPDEKLREVIETALGQNRDLRLAALNVELARALYGIRRAGLFPSLAVTGDGTKQHSSADLTRPLEPRTTERYAVDLGLLSWEIDFFGRIRSLEGRALEEYLATEQARRSAQVLLVSAVASTYLTLAADRENLALARDTLRTSKAAYELVKRQVEAGVATDLDLQQARVPVEVARGDVARLLSRTARDRNALDLLAGTPVPEELLPAKLAEVAPPREVSPGLPSEVLLRRPDVLQAEALLKAAHADIGAARAAFFPRVSLTALTGTASDQLSGLFGSGTGTWSYAPRFVMPIFDARTWAALDASRAQRKVVLARYEKAIQNAFREVADALAVHGTAGRRVAAQESLVDALAGAHTLSLSRFTRGVDSYLPVLYAERSLLAAREGLVSLRLARLLSRVRLYEALGGGCE